MKLNINKKNIVKSISLGLSGSLIFAGTFAGVHIDKKNGIDFYYINTKNINITNEELVNEFEEIFNSIEELKSNWSNIEYELVDFLSRYGQYLDQEELLDTLPNLKFEIVDGFKESENALAKTDYLRLKIYYSKKLFNRSQDIIDELTLHEAFHYMFHQNFSGGINYLNHTGIKLDEGIASLLTREYGKYADFDDYEKCVNYVRVLCELITPESFMDSIGHHNLNKLIDYLSGYCSKSDAKKLIEYIDNACVYFNSSNTEYDKKAWDIINEIYYNKNGVSIKNSNDVVMKIYSNELLDYEYDIDGAEYAYQAHVNKNYFINTENPEITYSRLGVDLGQADLNSDNSIKR